MQKTTTILPKQISLFTETGSMCLQEGSPASPFPLQAQEMAQMITVTSGRKCLKQSTLSGPLGSLLKTLLESSQWQTNIMYGTKYSLEWRVEALPAYRKWTSTKQYTHDKRKCYSTVSSRILKRSDIPGRHLLFRLRLRTHHTGETGSGLLPTPVAMDTATGNLEKIDQRRERIKEIGRAHV